MRRPGRAVASLLGTLALAWLSRAGTSPLLAQISATGSFSAYGEAYEHTGSGRGARPGTTGRLSANLTLSLFGGLVSAPLTALLSTDQVSFRQRIDQIGISPTYKSVTLHAGWFTPSWSRYTIADATVLGGGADLAPGRFRVGGLYGRAREAVSPKPGVISQAQWARWMAGGHVGYGDPRGSFLDLYLVRSEDKAGGIDSSVSTFPPPLEATTVAGARSQLSLAGGRVRLQVEAASSRYTRQDTVAFTAVTAPAVSASLLYHAAAWSLGTTAEYLDAGFVTLGNSGLSGDRLDLGLTGSARLLNGRLAVHGMGGWRRNNLKHDLAATTTQAIYNLGGTWQPAPAFGVDWQLANNISDNKARDDTSSIRNVTGLYTVTPRLLWRTGAVQHVLVVVGGVQRSQNTSPLSVALLDTRTTLLVGTWSATLPSSLAFTASATWTRVGLDTLGATTIGTVAPGLSYAFFGRTLQVQVQAQWMHATNPGGLTERELFPLLQLAYALARGQRVTVRSSVRHHAYSNTGSFDERVVSIQYSAALR